MPSVEKCPATLAEVNASSKLLNCGFDPYGNNRYMCLPNTEKSSLVEFCFDGLMGIQEKGIQYFWNKKTHIFKSINWKHEIVDMWLLLYSLLLPDKPNKNLAIYYKNN